MKSDLLCFSQQLLSLICFVHLSLIYMNVSVLLKVYQDVIRMTTASRDDPFRHQAALLRSDRREPEEDAPSRAA